jgi:tetratricopeptide (TPR) repeat protein
VTLVDERASQLPPRFVARTHQLRAEIYYQLYELAGNVPYYLELALADGKRALGFVGRDMELETFLRNVESRVADARKSAEAVTSKAPSRSDARATPELARGVLTLLGVAEKSEQTKALADLLTRGGELLAAGWQETDGLRGVLMNRFVNPYLDVSEQARSEAAAEAEAAHRILQTGLARGSLEASERLSARDHLLHAVEKNPRNAQYLFDLAVVEQDLQELDGAHDHLERATKIAPSNPLFVHQLALVDELRHRTEEALVHARKTEVLAPDGADFIAAHARLALDAEAAENDATKRASLHAEAIAALARLEKLAPQHAQVEALRTRLAPGSEPPRPSDG